MALRLGERLVAQPAAQRLLEGAEVVVSVPLHPRRERERGFNQATLLAREIGRHIGLPVAQGAVVRRLDTVSQAGLTARARRRNVASAFAVRRRGCISGRRVVLVDDVVTTGATASACAQALLDAGAAEVRLLSVARVV